MNVQRRRLAAKISSALVVLHAITWLVASFFIMLINVVTVLLLPLPWFFIPCICWGAAVFVHGLITFVILYGLSLHGEIKVLAVGMAQFVSESVEMLKCRTSIMIEHLFGRRKWPFKSLKNVGTYTCESLPIDGLEFEERQRDFMRIVRLKKKPGLYVVTPDSRVPEPWVSRDDLCSGRLSREDAAHVFEEFAAWLQVAARCKSDSDATSLARRCVALIAATEGLNFALKHDLPPLFPQSRFVLVLSDTGEVRVVWFAFVTSEPMPNLTCTPFMLKLISGDLNLGAAQACAAGTDMWYAVVRTTTTDIDQYVLTSEVQALRRAALESRWCQLLSEFA